MKRWVGACAIAAISTGCHDPDAYTLGPTAADQVLAVTLSARAIPADSISRVTITLQLDPETDADKRTITLTTTLGTLIGGGREGPTVSVQADTTGRAEAELRSGTTPGTARVDVTVAGVTRSQAIEFTPVSPSDLYDLALSRSSIPADGFSTSRITVTLKRLGTPQQRAVRFETSAGTLMATGQAAARQVTVTADSTGVAVADLQSDRTVGTARVRVTALDASRDTDIPFTRVNPDDIIALPTPRSAAARSAPADGVTPLTVTAVVASGLPAGRRIVTFRTTVGVFLPNRGGEFAIEADSSDTARADLVSLTPGSGRVTATVDGTTAETEVQFTVALPDMIVVGISSTTLRSGGTAAITATLVRSVGIVTPRQLVEFSASTDQGASIGSFTGDPVAQSTTVSVVFNLGTTSYLGGVTIRASVGGTVVGTARVQIVP